MGSLVPNITMSRGNNRKTKFNVSTNTHTTADFGYLQPLYSKLLLPNSDLKLKINDFVRMSSLVVPTFGDISLRHWFNCTPVSSLWSCLGSYLAGSQYNDLDDNSGSSVRQSMPMCSMNEIFGHMMYATLKPWTTGAYLPSCTAYLGNIVYLQKLVDAKPNHILSWDEFETDNIASVGTVALNTVYGLFSHEFGSVYDFSVNNQYMAQDIFEVRHRQFIPWFATGFVLANTDKLYKRFKDKNGNTTFPTPSECPYVLVKIGQYSNNDKIYPSNKIGTMSTSLIGDSVQSSVEFYPFTSKMYQGCTDLNLYTNGYFDKYVKATDTAYYHSGKTNGWSLEDGDSYFTGDLDSSTFDVSMLAYTKNDSNYSYKYGTAINWSRRFQRLRKLFVGLGYQFNPFDTQPQTMWKIFHYYKAWFDMFYPKRDTQYYQTPLSRIVNFISYHGRVCKKNMLDAYLEEANYNTTGYNYNFLGDFIDILLACADAKYLLPIDYYSLADPNPQEFESSPNEYIGDNAFVNNVVGTDPALPEYGSGVTDVNSSANLSLAAGGSDFSGIIRNFDTSTGNLDGLTIKLAQKLTKYLTKKRIVGKSVQDRLFALYGAVDPHDKSHEATWCFGTTSTQININAVMNQSETETMYLGDYAGQGLGGSTSRDFKVGNNTSDLYIVTIMSAIVPKISYYQGHSRENMIGLSPNEFGIVEWDGVGYEDVSASEYIADITHAGNQSFGGTTHRTMADINGQTIGLVPRYTWYKVNGHDTLNGDMSRPSVCASLNPYVLTRDVDPDFGISPIEMRTISPEIYNKIFNESNSLDDHFVIQAHIEAELYAPLKSISTSYDTFDADDDGSVEISHS